MAIIKMLFANRLLLSFLRFSLVLVFVITTFISTPVVSASELDVRTPYTGLKLPFKCGFPVSVSGSPSSHSGTERHAVDFSAPQPLPVFAMKDGIVAKVAYEYYPGYYILINHEDGSYAAYFHLSKQDVKEGDIVIQGQQIGISGKSGHRKDGTEMPYHLHVSVNKYIDKYTTATNNEIPIYFDEMPGRELKYSDKSTSKNCLCPSPSTTEFTFYNQAEGGLPDRCGGIGKSGYIKDVPPSNGNTFLIKEQTMPLGSVVFPSKCSDTAYTSLGGNGQFKILSTKSNFSLDVKDWNNSDNGEIQIWDWHGGSNQRWKFSLIDGSSDQYKIMAMNSYKCLTVNLWGNVIQKTCDSKDSQQIWKVEKINGSESVIAFLGAGIYHGKVLDVRNNSKKNGQKIIVYSRNNQENQKWQISTDSEFVVEIENLSSGKSAKIYSSDNNLQDNLQGILAPGDNYNLKITRTYTICPPTSSPSQMVAKASCIPNSPPYKPVIISPSSGYALRDQAPSLFWKQGIDPDGNNIEYYVEIFDSPVNLSSGWIRQTNWTPSALDGNYHSYKWRVKTRDELLSESGWSDTRIFSITSPNKPPNISFNSSNNNDADTILTREPHWIFIGTASDPENDLHRIDFSCSGDGCGFQSAHVNGLSWSHTQTGMWGENLVNFIAYDGFGNNTYSRTVKLMIDLVAPTTQIAINQTPTSTTWYITPVTISLRAQDGATGRARAGVDKLFYRIDDGLWQFIQGASIDLNVGGDGDHTIHAYAVDKLGNQEPIQSKHFRIDQTPPDMPSGAVESNGILNGVWQNITNFPAFTWAASQDATSGLWGYQLYFGPDPAGIGYENFPASAIREWTPFPYGVRTGSYYFRGRTRDIAGNWSAWTDLFIFQYDGTPPENPKEIIHSMGIKSSIWQRITSQPDFSWAIPHDEGSGIKGYRIYWGLDEYGTSDEIINQAGFSLYEGLCPGSACSGYLRLRSVDNVNNQSGDWTTTFILRYDDSPPSAEFTVNGGEGGTSQTMINLNIKAEDLGSGVKAMRFSMDGITWTPWEEYSSQRGWQIPPVSRQSWPIYLQVQDGVGLVSEVFTRSVAFDVNKEQPKSENFRLFDQAQTAGSDALESNSYQSHGTLGQIADAPVVNSTNYLSWTGYEAGSLAIPLIVPGHEEFQSINGTFTYGNGITIMASSGYRMSGTMGEAALPNNQPNLTSAEFKHQVGFLAALPSLQLSLVKDEGEDFEYEPEPDCTIPSIFIEGNVEFTNQTSVKLSLCAPNAVEMKISNNQDLEDASWERYTRQKYWILNNEIQEVMARFVYVAYKDANGVVYGTYMDDIILDQTRPNGTLLLNDDVSINQIVEMQSYYQTDQQIKGIPASLPFQQLDINPNYLSVNPDGSVNIIIDATDNNSGIVEMQFGANLNFTDSEWEDYAPLKTWMLPDEFDGTKTIYARFRDYAGNISYISSITFQIDQILPYAAMWIEQKFLHPDIRDIVVNFYAEDDIFDDESGELLHTGSGVVEMRIGEQPDLSDAIWQPFHDVLKWPVELEEIEEGAVFVQFRDLAGNVSDITRDSYYVDVAEPQINGSIVVGTGLNRLLEINAWDDLSGVANFYISNDHKMIEDIVRIEFTEDPIPWLFNEQRVVWIQAEDGAGNRSLPYPIMATDQGLPVFLPLVLN